MRPRFWSSKGLSALQLGRDLSVSYKTAFVLAHKLREALGAEMKGFGDYIVDTYGNRR